MPDRQETLSRKERSDRSIEAIIEAAFRVIAENSISGTTTSRISEKAGVSKPLLHYHFRNKKEILDRVLRDLVLERLLEIPLEDANKNLPAMDEIKGIFKRYKAAITADPDLLVVFYDFWVRGGKDRSVREIIVRRFDAFRGYILQLIMEGISRGEFNAEKSHMVAPMMISFLEGAAIQLISDPDAFNYDLYQFMAIEMIGSFMSVGGK